MTTRMMYRRYGRRELVTVSPKLCPTCKRQTLTEYEARKGYQCLDCTRKDEAEF